MENMFDPDFWTAMDPRSFVYGDGVYGIDRKTKMSFPEYLRYLFNRDELEYDSVFDGPPEGPAPPSAGEQGLTGQAHVLPQ
eukprot:9394915-Karenia_brevis.AAC.1